MRILHVHHALYLPVVYARELRRRGYEAATLYFSPPEYTALTGKPDYNLGPLSSIFSNWKLYIDFFWRRLNTFDLFHFHGESCFISSFSRLYRVHRWLGLPDLRYLRALGKKIVYSHWGCKNGRLRSTFQLENDGKTCLNCRQGAIGQACSDEFIRRVCQPQEEFGWAIINHEPDFQDYNRRAHYQPAIVDFDTFQAGGDIPPQFRIHKKPGYFYIYHAVGGFFNRSNERGTEVIARTIAAMQADGHKIDMINVNGRVPSYHVKYYQQQADLAIDHLYYGWYGNMVRECMAQGIPVATYINPTWEARHILHYGSPPPLIQVTEDNLRDTLEHFITRRGELRDVRLDQQRYLQNIHDTDKVIDRLVKLYQD
ncbi:MAG TPA: hypothetical protein VEF33_00310 [Syntrophales bacterium]|nr:hypothetical protein [Syntrophales bacterium]